MMRWLPLAWADERGSAVLLAMPLVALTVVAGVLLFDLTAYLAAAGRAQGAADAAALAAAAVAHPDRTLTGDPQRAAEATARAWGGRLDACRCRVGTRTVRTTVSVGVEALVLTRLAGRRVTAVAQATLVPP